MRKNSTDKYEKIALIGNNSYDIIFMHYLIESQNISSFYNTKYKVSNADELKKLRQIAYYFGMNGPILIDNKGLRKIFDENGIPRNSDLPKLNAEDIIEQIDMCLNSDVVYICNSFGALDKSTMFILGYLMAKEQEIFFWNEMDESEWLMTCISKKSINGYKENIQYPLEIIRTLAYPSLFKNINTDIKAGRYGELIITESGNYGVDRNTEFNLPVNSSFLESENTVCFLGSLTKQLDAIKEQAKLFQNKGYKVLAPQISKVKTDLNGFIIFEDDNSSNPIVIESDFLEKCMRAESIVVCDKDGYIGNTVMLELGYLLGKNKHFKFIDSPKEEWLLGTINYYLNKYKEEVVLEKRK